MCVAFIHHHSLTLLSFLLSLTHHLQSKDNDGSQKITGVQLGDFYKELARDFPIVSIEDPFDQVRSHLL